MWLFMICFDATALLAILVYVIEWDTIVADEQVLYITEIIMYPMGLAALYFGWRLIDHKFPSKHDRNES